MSKNVHQGHIKGEFFVVLYSSKYFKKILRRLINFLLVIFSCFNCSETNNVGGKKESENPDCVSVLSLCALRGGFCVIRYCVSIRM